MMARATPQKVRLIPIDRITVLNPRSRNRRQHREIVDNIEMIGLKRPITVRRRPATDGVAYDLVCGEGRLEAFRQLGEAKIPAIVIDAEEDDCLVMSLVENVARRQHRPIDIIQEVGSLHERGYSDAEIGQKIGYTTSWVSMIIQLFERGEERLLTAVETGQIPISLAVDIARAGTEEAQDILMEAYEAGRIKGRKVAVIRRILDQRLRRTKSMRANPFGRKNGPRRVTTAELMRMYQREAEKQRVLVKKADFTQNRLLFIVEALRDLLADEGFTTLLRAEGLADMPRPLADRIRGATLQ